MMGTYHKTDLENLPEQTGLVEQGHILQDWFVFRESRHFGPLSTQQVRSFLSKKLISNEHFIWRPGFENWLPIQEVEGFQSYGQKSRDLCSDEEFSYKAKLGYIDRIGAEAVNLDFTEGEKPKTKEEVLAEENKKELNPILKAFCGYFGIGEAYLNYGRILSAVIIMAVMGALFYNYSEPSYMAHLDQLPRSVKQEFMEIANKPINLRKPSLELFEIKSKFGEPVLLGVSNVPSETRFRLDIIGEQGTLVGTYRFDKTIEAKTEGRVFKTMPVRQASGKYLPPGRYSITVSCLDCAEKEQVLYRGKQLLGVENRISYNKDLQKFALASREKIRLELDELEDLSYTLFNQYKSTADQFLKGFSGNKSSQWQQFSSQWLERQNKLVELFQQVKAETFKESLYYLGLYESYGKLVRQIFELHMFQDGVIATRNPAADSLESQGAIVKLTQDIDVNLKAIKAQADIARAKFNQGEGFPEVE